MPVSLLQSPRNCLIPSRTPLRGKRPSPAGTRGAGDTLASEGSPPRETTYRFRREIVAMDVVTESDSLEDFDNHSFRLGSVRIHEKIQIPEPDDPVVPTRCQGPSVGRECERPDPAPSLVRRKVRSRHVSTSQSRKLPSPPPPASTRPSGENAMAETPQSGPVSEHAHAAKEGPRAGSPSPGSLTWPGSDRREKRRETSASLAADPGRTRLPAMSDHRS